MTKTGVCVSSCGSFHSTFAMMLYFARIEIHPKVALIQGENVILLFLINALGFLLVFVVKKKGHPFFSWGTKTE